MKCVLCGRVVQPKGNNFILVDNKPMHKKCPKPKEKLTEQELNELNILKQELFRYANNCPKGYMVGRTMNWTRVMGVIGNMHKRGYSYGEINYALDKVVEEMDGFWGIGAVDKRIDVIIAKKRDVEQKSQLYKDKPTKEEVVDLRNLISNDWGEDEW